MKYDSSLTVGEQRRKQSNQPDSRMTEDQKSFMEEKQIHMSDYGDLFNWFYGDFTTRSDEELRDALEECYRTRLALSLGWEYPG